MTVFAVVEQYLLGQKDSRILSFTIEEKTCENAAVKSIHIMN